MKKILNRLLSRIGFNVVKTKRTRVKKAVRKCVPSPDCCQDVYNAGKTHYVGNDCSGGHQVGYKAKAFVVNPDANFVPVDIDGPTTGGKVSAHFVSRL